LCVGRRGRRRATMTGRSLSLIKSPAKLWRGVRGKYRVDGVKCDMEV
jgi:hypothetical protein